MQREQNADVENDVAQTLRSVVWLQEIGLRFLNAASVFCQVDITKAEFDLLSTSLHQSPDRNATSALVEHTSGGAGGHFAVELEILIPRDHVAAHRTLAGKLVETAAVQQTHLRKHDAVCIGDRSEFLQLKFHLEFVLNFFA